MPHCENGAKTRLAADHMFVRLGRALERKNFSHSTHAGKHAEGERILRINRAAGRPSDDRPPAADHQSSIDFEGLISSTEDDQFSIDAKTAQDCAHRLAAR